MNKAAEAHQRIDGTECGYLALDLPNGQGQFCTKCGWGRSKWEAIRQTIPCPTCGGEAVEFAGDDDDIGDACPDCTDGKISMARLLAVGAAVMTEPLFHLPQDTWKGKRMLAEDEAHDELLARLRAAGGQ